MKSSILIVENDKNTRESLARALSGNYIVLTASNGKEASNLLDQNQNIDIVVTDIMMYEMGGFELLERIRSTNKNINTIMITGHSDIFSAEAAINKGAYDYLSKPIELDKLEISIKNAIKSKKLRFWDEG